MHPDDAVDLALQDLRSLTHQAAAVALPAPRLAPSPLRALWRRYVHGWTWYAASGLALPEASASVPPRRGRSVPSARKVRVAAPCAHHRFELLFGRPAAAECR
ncbi:MAG TPA: hypothetical protein VF541_22415 [Longimicrobium sp.]